MNSYNAITNDVLMLFQKVFTNKEMFFQFLDKLPYAIGVFKPDSTIVFVNRTYLDQMNLANLNDLVGIQLIKAQELHKKIGIYDFFHQLFKGRVVSIEGISFEPNFDIPHYISKKEDSQNEFATHNLYGFPILDEHKKVTYLVTTSYITNIYKGKKEILEAQRYMHDNWLEKFSLDKISKVIGFDVKHFSILFKEYARQSPQEYYDYIKINKLKEKLNNLSINIEDAFTNCRITHNEKYNQLFKKIVGLTPNQYQSLQKHMKQTISNEIYDMGFNLKHTGTKYLIDAILFIYNSNNSDFLSNLEKNVYPIIAKKHNKTALSIKSNIVKAVNYMDNCINNSKLKSDIKPTPKLIIQLIVDKLSY